MTHVVTLEFTPVAIGIKKKFESAVGTANLQVPKHMNCNHTLTAIQSGAAKIFSAPCPGWKFLSLSSQPQPLTVETTLYTGKF